MIIPIIVQVENAVDFAVVAHVDVVHVLHAFADRLAGVLLHLNVVEFPVGWKKKRCCYRKKINKMNHFNLGKSESQVTNSTSQCTADDI